MKIIKKREQENIIKKTEKHTKGYISMCIINGVKLKAKNNKIK